MIKIETRAFQLAVRRELKRYRLDVFKSLAQNIDSIRFNAANFIIPRRSDISDRMSSYKMSKLQPSTPGKVTERTSRLIKMLKSAGKWDFHAQTYNRGGFDYAATKSATMTTPAFKGMIKVVEGLNTISEQYQATLKVDISDSNPWTGLERGSDLRSDLISGKTMIMRKYITKQQLAMRFKHETGIRGERRPFIEPAIKQEEFKVQSIISDKIGRLGKL